MFRMFGWFLAASSVIFSFSCESATMDVDDSHACVVIDGGVRCWGDNERGSLGTPGLRDSALAVDVAGLAPGSGRGATAVAVGSAASCAIVEGGLLCWGANPNGILGNGTSQDAFVPAPVPGLEPGTGAEVTDISIGDTHACAAVAGGVMCWGGNADGQLGDGTTHAHAMPEPVTGLEPGTGKGVVAVATGYFHSCAVGLFGAKCWGRNRHPVFGAEQQSSLPLLIPNLAGPISAVDAADVTTCVIGGGVMKCWGDAPFGNGSNVGSDTPVTVNTVPSPVTDISLGHRAGDFMRHSCAIAFSTAYCWGGGAYGQLGNGNPANQLLPQAVTGFGAANGAATAIAAGFRHTCGMHSTAGLRCWGAIGLGLVGDGRYARQLTPDPVAAPATSGVTQLAAAGGHTCALINAKVWCWGSNGKGELGDGTFQLRRAPVQVFGLDNVTSISVGNEHSCAVRTGQVLCWGSNLAGQLGQNPANLATSSLPMLVAGISQATAVHGGRASHTCATTAANALYCWGYNAQGQTGASNPDGSPDTTASWQPTQVFASSVTAAAVGMGHSCAVVAGGVACWGHDAAGELGNGAGGGGPQPSQVVGLGPGAGATSLSAGDVYTCAVVNGGVKCWGFDFLSTFTDAPVFSETPQEVGLPAGSGVSMVATSTATTCAVVNGTAHCWGYGIYGSLGDGDVLNRASPTPVAGLQANVTTLATTGFHSCAVASGAATCWGWTLDGRLGNLATGLQETPVPVLESRIFRSGFE